MSKRQPKSSAFSPGKQSMWQILLSTARLYRQHGCAFTRVLLPSIGKMALGIYACLLLSYGLMVWMDTLAPVVVYNYGWLFLLLLGVISLVTLIIFFVGGWEYLIYWASLNINAKQAIEGRPIDFHAAYQEIAVTKGKPYQGLILISCLLPMVAGLPISIASLFSLVLGSEALFAMPVLWIAALLLTAVLSLAWIISVIFFTFIFQVVAFEAEIPSPWPIFLRSAKLVLKRPWSVLGLQVILFLLTNYLLTAPVAYLLSLLKITFPLDWIHQWLGKIMLDNLAINEELTPWLSGFWPSLQSGLPDTANGVSISVVMLFLTLLLLPLGTFAFTLLYMDLDVTFDAPASADPK